MKTDSLYSLNIQQLIQRGIGPELHWFPEDVQHSSIAAVLVGMANTIGGMLIVGVTPRSGKILGVSDPAGVIDRILQAMLSADPPLILPVPEIVRIGSAELVITMIPNGLPHVYSLDGRYLGREAAQTHPMPARRLRQLLVERGVVQFEAQVPVDARLEDLNMDAAANYARSLGLPGNESVEIVLARRGCLKHVEDKAPGGVDFKPTYAGLLLFGTHPQQWLPNATILAARFSGSTFSDQYIKQEISGNLVNQLRQAEVFFRDHIRSVVRLVGLTHQESPEYPFEAVRELLVNAVAHRDYNHQGDSIHLNLFSDRIEVHSPGGLPGPVNLDNLLEARFSRNAILVQVLADMGFVERLGYGLDRVVKTVRQAGLRPPRFEETAGAFRVTLFGETLPLADRKLPDLEKYRTMDLNERQQAALVYLAANRRITNREYQELCPDVHAETLRRDLADLVSRNVLLKVGDKRSTYYILK